MKSLVVRKGDLQACVGVSVPTANRLERLGKFPKRRQLADGSVGWIVRELEEWAESRPVAVGGLRGEHRRRAAGSVAPSAPPAMAAASSNPDDE